MGDDFFFIKGRRSKKDSSITTMIYPRSLDSVIARDGKDVRVLETTPEDPPIFSGIVEIIVDSQIETDDSSPQSVAG